MGATTIYGFPYHELTDPPDGAALGRNLAEAVEAEIDRLDTDDTGWIEPALSNGWTNVNGAAYPIRYRRRHGITYLGGSVTGGANGSTVFTLPAGFRPIYQQRFGASFTTGADAIVVIRPTGVVEITLASGVSNASIDAAFPADA